MSFVFGLKAPRFPAQVCRAHPVLPHKPTAPSRDRTVVEVVLGNAPFVSVMQTTDFRNRNNPADRLHGTRIRRIFIQGQMKTASVVITDIRSQYAAQSFFVQDNRVVTSPDAENGELIRLVVSPKRIESAEPKDPVVSFPVPKAHDFDTSAVNVMAKFCHFVFFFTSRSSGERWMGKHPGTFLYSPDEAFALGKRLNLRNLGPELVRCAPSPGLTGVSSSDFS